MTNVLLYGWHMHNNEFCTFCKTTTETIAHVLYECPLIQTIWTHLQQYLLSRGLQLHSPYLT